MHSILAVLIVLAVPLPGLAQGSVECMPDLGGEVLPLPPGPWRVPTQGAVRGRSREGSFATATHRAVLLQERRGRAAAVVVAPLPSPF